MSPTQKAAAKMRSVQRPGNLYSFSSLSMFRDCPHRWYCTYAMGWREKPNFYTAYGHLVHAATSMALRADPHINSPQTALNWVSKARQQYNDEATLVPLTLDSEIAASVIAAAAALPESPGPIILESALVQPLPAKPPQPLNIAECERLLVATDIPYAYFKVLDRLAAASCDAIQIRPDLILSAIPLIRDWKTGKAVPPGILAARYGAQLQLYAAVARHRWPEIQCDLQCFAMNSTVPVDTSPSALDAAARGAMDTIRCCASRY